MRSERPSLRQKKNGTRNTNEIRKAIIESNDANIKLNPNQSTADPSSQQEDGEQQLHPFFSSFHIPVHQLPVHPRAAPFRRAFTTSKHAVEVFGSGGVVAERPTPD
uniref:Uncharacterized protein orf105-h n=2 Tax=Zea mays TaxID=4577 RepID=Q1KKB3_MAIZE|nr:hypothetical protein ZemapapMp14 [Zea mays subsp. parviglumis]ABE98751.1 hypothetical protein [Zea mays subsp. mays]ABE98792.1 hypothetical protein [Zea mays subsp. mays]ABF70875.1 hypothetical protein [Zea mays subsp. parviglumis]